MGKKNAFQALKSRKPCDAGVGRLVLFSQMLGEKWVWGEREVSARLPLAGHAVGVPAYRASPRGESLCRRSKRGRKRDPGLAGPRSPGPLRRVSREPARWMEAGKGKGQGPRRRNPECGARSGHRGRPLLAPFEGPTSTSGGGTRCAQSRLSQMGLPVRTRLHWQALNSRGTR